MINLSHKLSESRYEASPTTKVHPLGVSTIRSKSFMHKAYDKIHVVGTRISLLWVCLAVFIILAVACIIVVYISANAVAEQDKQLVYNGIAAEVEYSLRNLLERMSYGVLALASAVSLNPTCASLTTSFSNISESLLTWSDSSRFYLDPNGMARFDYPPITELEPLPRGFNFFYASPVEMKKRIKNNEMIYFGPFQHPEGFPAMYAMWPMWLPASSGAANLGCGAFIYNCTTDCYNAETGKKFYGIARALLNVEDLFTGEARCLDSTIDQGYDIRLRVAQLPEKDLNYRFQRQIYNKKEHKPNDPIIRKVYISNLQWEILIAPKQGWIPAWRDDTINILIAGCFVFAALVYWLLLARDKYNQLLLSMLPKRVIDHLANKVGVFSEEFEMVTILFTDICNFTPLASQLTPIQIVAMLDDLYHLYDDLASKHGVYKVETIGDAYMCVCGCPDREKPEVSAMRMIAMAKDIIQTANGFKRSYIPKDITFQVRVGIHSGGVVAGVVGRKMPRYCLFGDVVNTASRMESNSLPMKIHISEYTKKLLDPTIGVVSRGTNYIKGKGQMETFFLDYEPVNLSATDQVVDVYDYEEVSGTGSPKRRKPKTALNVAFRWLGNDDSSLDV